MVRDKLQAAQAAIIYEKDDVGLRLVRYRAHATFDRGEAIRCLDGGRGNLRWDGQIHGRAATVASSDNRGVLNLRPKLLDACKGRGEQRAKDTTLSGVQRPWSVEAHLLSVARRYPDPILTAEYERPLDAAHRAGVWLG